MTIVEAEQWKEIPEFPDYEINPLGEIYNRKTHGLMRTSLTNHGHAKITLQAENKRRHTRSVALLVADAFVRPPNFMCDHIIVLDGDYANVRADNLAWRPRWFAWKYAHQLKSEQPIAYQNLRVLNTEHHIEYDCVIHAGMCEGLLFEDIWRSTYSGALLFPTGSAFEVVERV